MQFINTLRNKDNKLLFFLSLEWQYEQNMILR